MANDPARLQARLQKEILTTLRIQHPDIPQSSALRTLVGNTIKSLGKAGISSVETTRLTLIVAQKFMRDLPVGASGEANEA